MTEKREGYDVTGWEFNDDGSVKFASALTFKALPMDNRGIAIRFEYQPSYKPGQVPPPAGAVQLAISTTQAAIIADHLTKIADALNQYSAEPPKTRQ